MAYQVESFYQQTDFEKEQKEAQEDLLSRLSNLKIKVHNLKNEGLIGLFFIAQTLHRRLDQSLKKYIDQKIDYSIFWERSHSQIALTKVHLIKHEGWKEFLGDLDLSLMALNPEYLKRVCVHNARFFKLSSENIMFDPASSLPENAKHSP